MILKALNVSKTYRMKRKEVCVLQNIHLSVDAGDSVSILGASGIGKSTLLLILGSIEKPSSGQIFIKGQDVQKWGAKIRSRDVGFLFQSCFLLEEESVLDNVLLPARIAKKKTCRGSYPYQRALELIECTGLSDRLDFPCKYLSGGEKARVALARGLINDPDLLLADEPTGNLDGASAQKIIELMWQLTVKRQKALVIVSHDENLLKETDRKYLLHNAVLQDVTTGFAKNAHPDSFALKPRTHFKSGRSS